MGNGACVSIGEIGGIRGNAITVIPSFGEDGTDEEGTIRRRVAARGAGKEVVTLVNEIVGLCRTGKV